jgi:transposase-like protein
MEIKMRIPNNQRYSEAFKRQVVREYERGGVIGWIKK